MLCPKYEVTMKIISTRTSNQLSKPRGSTDENLTGCLERYVVLGSERDQQHLNFTTNNRILQMIRMEDNCDFFEEIEIFTFLFSQEFGRSNSSNSITHLEQPEPAMLPRKQKAMNVNGSMAVWRHRNVK
jgi:hypothetical protein